MNYSVDIYEYDRKYDRDNIRDSVFSKDIEALSHISLKHFLKCDTCNFRYDIYQYDIDICGRISNKIKGDVLIAAVKGSKALEEIKPYYDLEFDRSFKYDHDKTYEKALLFAQKHTDKRHNVKYYSRIKQSYLPIMDIIIDKNGEKKQVDYPNNEKILQSSIEQDVKHLSCLAEVNNFKQHKRLIIK